MDSSYEITRIRATIGRDLTPEEEQQVDYWVKGTALRSYTEVVGIMFQLLAEEVDIAGAELIAGKFPLDSELREAHAAARSSNELFQKLKDKVSRMIELSRETTEVAKEAFRRLGPQV